MKKTMIAAALAASVLSAGAANAAGMKLSSPDIKSGGKIANEQVFKGFGCSGDNISPALTWSGAPKNAKSFALTVYDPDAPTGSGWWHWVVFNIPATATSLPKNAGDVKGGGMPQGAVQSRTDFGTGGWGGPCPPKGDKPHHYIFTVYALDVDHLDGPDANASGALVGFLVHAHTVKGGKASFTGLYGR